MKRGLSLMVCAAVVLTVGCHGGKQESGTTAQGSSDKGSSEKGGANAKQGGGSSAASGSGEGKDGSVPTDAVRIPREDQQKAGIRVAEVIVRSMPRVLAVTGQVAMDERHTDHIGALADGRVESVYVLPGDAVRRGQTLATQHSHLVHETVAALTQAFAAESRQQSAVTFAGQARDRYAKLYSIQAASLEEKQRSEQEVAQSQQDLIDAQANVHAEREHLSELLQVEPETLKPGTLYQKELIPIRAVSDGVIIARNVTPGQVVNTGDETFVTSNLSTIWVNAAVNEKDLSDVHIGAAATVLVQGATGQGMPGRVTMLGDMVDPQTRTLPVRLAVPNPGTKLRPGMFATASIAKPASRMTIFVPSGALQDVNGFRVVFATKDGTTFQARIVKTGMETNGLVEVVEGLEPTDHVAVDGAFMVKGELLKGTVGDS